MTDWTNRCHFGDCLETLRRMPDGLVQTCVTSPPYFGLRDYGHAGQIGLEPTPDEFVAKLVTVFREVRRVLRDDGTLWVNIGDSYTSGGRTHERDPDAKNVAVGTGARRAALPDGLKPKDLIGIPWMLAFALRADGWYLRQEIIWHKPNPMPESVTDRCTKSHEQIFLLAKGQWKSAVVKFADLSNERGHFGSRLACGEAASREPLTQFCVRLATALLNAAQSQHDVALPPFYAEVWKQRADGLDSDFVGSLPKKHRAAVFAARLLCADVSPKEFVSQINGLPVALPKGYQLLESGGDPFGPLPPSIHCDGNTSITINDAGKVGKFDFGHGHIVVSAPTTCNYYCDMGAIKEPAVADHAPGNHSHKGTTAYEQEEGEHHRTKAGLVAYAQRQRSKRDSFKRDDSKRAEAIPGQSVGTHRDDREESDWPLDTRNKRSVWTVSTKPYKGAHFATFPPDLIEPCILAGAPAGGIVLDPFFGSGTTGQVAQALGRQFIGLELNEAYKPLQDERLRQPSLMLEAA